MSTIKRSTTPPDRAGEYDRGAMSMGKNIDSQKKLGQSSTLKQALNMASQIPGSEFITWQAKDQYTVHQSSVSFADKLDIGNHVENVARNVLAFVAENGEFALNYLSGLNPQKGILPDDQEIFKLDKVMSYIRHEYGNQLVDKLTSQLNGLKVSEGDRQTLLKELAIHLARFDVTVDGKSTIEDAFSIALSLPEPHKSEILKEGAVQLYQKGETERVRYWVTQIQSAEARATVRHLFIEDALRFRQPDQALEYMRSIPLPQDEQGQLIDDLTRARIAQSCIQSDKLDKAHQVVDCIQNLEIKNQFFESREETHQLVDTQDIRLA